MNFRLAMPAVLVDLNALDDLAYIKEDAGGGLRVGGDDAAPSRSNAAMSSGAGRRSSHETMPSIAHPAIRTRGTIGGSLAHADPAAELPAVMLALDAHIRRAEPTRRARDSRRPSSSPACSRRRSSQASW